MILPSGWDLPAAIASRLGDSAGRQRAIIAEGHLFLILHKLPDPESSAREGVFFWRLPSGEWRASTGGNGLTALKRHLETYAVAIDGLEALYDRANDSRGFFQVLEVVVPLHRAVANSYAALQMAREVLPDVHELISLRDETYDFERATDLLQIDARNALDYQIARQNEEQARFADETSRASQRLNVIAAIFLPLSTLTGVFGMSLHSGLEDAPPVLFWSIFLIGTGIGLFLGLLLSRKSR